MPNIGLKLNEWIFIFAGMATFAAIPHLEIVGFPLWLFVKSIYFLGIVVLFIEMNPVRSRGRRPRPASYGMEK